ncbi:phosphoribosyltransferase family protein [Flavobacterium sp. DG1-102-2]|uniref:phosphoribosyltransferase family protein n=1 Tax=Flavobacterium sp. DG1-102-2 TaxID=3081663 RepID=UPI0029499D82|nr:phosphoribosyltransferase family protein [Flavobacterium sp. DG1-102-2]MDV6168491.1 phosphoribosyltransferase family protein [Flavobacterium sp. DG1-102-2]
MKNIILTQQEIDHKTKRIAYQIYETFPEDTEVVLAGIAKNGFLFAKKLAAEVEKISYIKVTLCEVKINKNQPLEPVTTSLTAEEYTNKSLVLIDDVLNSGTTLIYGVKHFLDVPLKKFKTAVLVDRNHKQYPVKADFKGLSLSTSLRENVQVVLDEKEQYAYLED